MENVPNHIAIIMDGNRRWAKSHNLEPKLGHSEGAKRLREMAIYCNKIGIKHLTVYAFSTENWKRSEDEVNALMLLLKKYLEDVAKKVNTENIQIKVLGDISRLSKGLQESIQNVIEKTKNNTGMILNIAFNYGGRDEIKKAVKEIANDVKEGIISIDDITEDLIQDHLYTKGQPDPDLLIRTSGEIRLSNFLPWQLSYTEFFFVQKHWPAFTEEDLNEVIQEYQGRHRNFGGNG